MLREEGIERVDVIRLDVEYAEAGVLAGAQRTFGANSDLAVFFEETNPSREAPSKGILRDLGFSVRRLARNVYVASRS